MKDHARRNRIMSARRVMVYSALAFLVLSLISTGVYYFTGYLNDPLRGFFDSVSAFSATGLSLFPKPLELPVWLRIFRAGCQWIGGGMSLAILALLMSSPDGDSMAGETSESYSSICPLQSFCLRFWKLQAAGSPIPYAWRLQPYQQAECRPVRCFPMDSPRQS